MTQNITSKARKNSAISPKKSSLLIALEATFIAGVIMLVFILLGNYIANNILISRVDNNLLKQINIDKSEITERSSSSLFDVIPNFDSDHDLTDIPIVTWWINTSNNNSLSQSSKSPFSLPKSILSVSNPVTAKVNNTLFRFEGTNFKNGRIVVGISLNQMSKELETLRFGEYILSPIFLLIFFSIAFLIALKSAQTLNKTRVKQLDFMADISHELRTPLSVIEAEVTLALSQKRNAEDLKSSLKRVVHEVDRLKRNVDGLLWIARLDNDQVIEDLDFELIDLGGLIENAYNRFLPLANQKHLEFLKEIVSDDILIVGPPTWIDQVLGILIDNAVKYTPENGTIKISGSSNKKTATVTVEDSGSGIDEQDIELIFDRFYRTSSNNSGTGLGLSIASRIIREIGASWDVGRSHLGGAKFGITFNIGKNT